MSLLIRLPFLVALVLLLVPLDLPLSYAQTIDELKAGVVKIAATHPGRHRLGTGFLVGIEEEVVLPQELFGKDGAPMVLVPAGEFTMGSLEGEGEADEYPEHIVYLNDFFIDQYEVTVEKYHRFMQAQNHRAPKFWDDLVVLKRDAQKPVVGIDWQDAHDYCAWAGKRLPTEAEWEKTARGTDNRTYPWGEFSSNPSTANFAKKWSENAYVDNLTDVGTYDRGKSPYGVYDMAGNVSEWVQDWYAEDFYKTSRKKNPIGPSSGKRRVLRGGSWVNTPYRMRSAYRYAFDPTYRIGYLGFRCAQDAP